MNSISITISADSPPPVDETDVLSSPEVLSPVSDSETSGSENEAEPCPEQDPSSDPHETSEAAPQVPSTSSVQEDEKKNTEEQEEEEEVDLLWTSSVPQALQHIPLVTMEPSMFYLGRRHPSGCGQAFLSAPNDICCSRNVGDTSPYGGRSRSLSAPSSLDWIESTASGGLDLLCGALGRHSSDTSDSEIEVTTAEENVTIHHKKTRRDAHKKLRKRQRQESAALRQALKRTREGMQEQHTQECKEALLTGQDVCALVMMQQEEIQNFQGIQQQKMADLHQMHQLEKQEQARKWGEEGHGSERETSSDDSIEVMGKTTSSGIRPPFQKEEHTQNTKEEKAYNSDSCGPYSLQEPSNTACTYLNSKKRSKSAPELNDRTGSYPVMPKGICPPEFCLYMKNGTCPLYPEETPGSPQSMPTSEELRAYFIGLAEGEFAGMQEDVLEAQDGMGSLKGLKKSLPDTISKSSRGSTYGEGDLPKPLKEKEYQLELGRHPQAGSDSEDLASRVHERMQSAYIYICDSSTSKQPSIQPIPKRFYFGFLGATGSCDGMCLYDSLYELFSGREGSYSDASGEEGASIEKWLDFQKTKDLVAVGSDKDVHHESKSGSRSTSSDSSDSLGIQTMFMCASPELGDTLGTSKGADQDQSGDLGGKGSANDGDKGALGDASGDVGATGAIGGATGGSGGNPPGKGDDSDDKDTKSFQKEKDSKSKKEDTKPKKRRKKKKKKKKTRRQLRELYQSVSRPWDTLYNEYSVTQEHTAKHKKKKKKKWKSSYINIDVAKATHTIKKQFCFDCYIRYLCELEGIYQEQRREVEQNGGNIEEVEATHKKKQEALYNDYVEEQKALEDEYNKDKLKKVVHSTKKEDSSDSVSEGHLESEESEKSTATKRKRLTNNRKKFQHEQHRKSWRQRLGANIRIEEAIDRHLWEQKKCEKENGSLDTLFLIQTEELNGIIYEENHKKKKLEERRQEALKKYKEENQWSPHYFSWFWTCGSEGLLESSSESPSTESDGFLQNSDLDLRGIVSVSDSDLSMSSSSEDEYWEHGKSKGKDDAQQKSQKRRRKYLESRQDFASRRIRETLKQTKKQEGDGATPPLICTWVSSVGGMGAPIPPSQQTFFGVTDGSSTDEEQEKKVRTVGVKSHHEKKTSEKERKRKKKFSRNRQARHRKMRVQLEKQTYWRHYVDCCLRMNKKHEEERARAQASGGNLETLLERQQQEEQRLCQQANTDWQRIIQHQKISSSSESSSKECSKEFYDSTEKHGTEQRAISLKKPSQPLRKKLSDTKKAYLDAKKLQHKQQKVKEKFLEHQIEKQKQLEAKQKAEVKYSVYDGEVLNEKHKRQREKLFKESKERYDKLLEKHKSDLKEAMKKLKLSKKSKQKLSRESQNFFTSSIEFFSRLLLWVKNAGPWKTADTVVQSDDDGFSPTESVVEAPKVEASNLASPCLTYEETSSGHSGDFSSSDGECVEGDNQHVELRRIQKEEKRCRKKHITEINKLSKKHAQEKMTFYNRQKLMQRNMIQFMNQKSLVGIERREKKKLLKSQQKEKKALEQKQQEELQAILTQRDKIHTMGSRHHHHSKILSDTKTEEPVSQAHLSMQSDVELSPEEHLSLVSMLGLGFCIKTVNAAELRTSDLEETKEQEQNEDTTKPSSDVGSDSETSSSSSSWKSHKVHAVGSPEPPGNNAPPPSPPSARRDGVSQHNQNNNNNNNNNETAAGSGQPSEQEPFEQQAGNTTSSVTESQATGAVGGASGGDDGFDQNAGGKKHDDTSQPERTKKEKKRVCKRCNQLRKKHKEQKIRFTFDHRKALDKLKVDQEKRRQQCLTEVMSLEESNAICAQEMELFLSTQDLLRKELCRQQAKEQRESALEAHPIEYDDTSSEEEEMCSYDTDDSSDDEGTGGGGGTGVWSFLPTYLTGQGQEGDITCMPKYPLLGLLDIQQPSANVLARQVPSNEQAGPSGSKDTKDTSNNDGQKGQGNGQGDPPSGCGPSGAGAGGNGDGEERKDKESKDAFEKKKKKKKKRERTPQEQEDFFARQKKERNELEKRHRRILQELKAVYGANTGVLTTFIFEQKAAYEALLRKQEKERHCWEEGSSDEEQQLEKEQQPEPETQCTYAEIQTHAQRETPPSTSSQEQGEGQYEEQGDAIEAEGIPQPVTPVDTVVDTPVEEPSGEATGLLEDTTFEQAGPIDTDSQQDSSKHTRKKKKKKKKEYKKSQELTEKHQKELKVIEEQHKRKCLLLYDIHEVRMKIAPEETVSLKDQIEEFFAEQRAICRAFEASKQKLVARQCQEEEKEKQQQEQEQSVSEYETASSSSSDIESKGAIGGVLEHHEEPTQPVDKETLALLIKPTQPKGDMEGGPSAGPGPPDDHVSSSPTPSTPQEMETMSIMLSEKDTSLRDSAASTYTSSAEQASNEDDSACKDGVCTKKRKNKKVSKKELTSKLGYSVRKGALQCIERGEKETLAQKQLIESGGMDWNIVKMMPQRLGVRLDLIELTRQHLALQKEESVLHNQHMGLRERLQRIYKNETNEYSTDSDGTSHYAQREADRKQRRKCRWRKEAEDSGHIPHSAESRTMFSSRQKTERKALEEKHRNERDTFHEKQVNTAGEAAYGQIQTVLREQICSRQREEKVALERRHQEEKKQREERRTESKIVREELQLEEQYRTHMKVLLKSQSKQKQQLRKKQKRELAAAGSNREIRALLHRHEVQLASLLQQQDEEKKQIQASHSSWEKYLFGQYAKKLGTKKKHPHSKRVSQESESDSSSLSWDAFLTSPDTEEDSKSSLWDSGSTSDRSVTTSPQRPSVQEVGTTSVEPSQDVESASASLDELFPPPPPPPTTTTTNTTGEIVGGARRKQPQVQPTSSHRGYKKHHPKRKQKEILQSELNKRYEHIEKQAAKIEANNTRRLREEEKSVRDFCRDPRVSWSDREKKCREFIALQETLPTLSLTEKTETKDYIDKSIQRGVQVLDNPSWFGAYGLLDELLQEQMSLTCFSRGGTDSCPSDEEKGATGGVDEDLESKEESFITKLEKFFTLDKGKKPSEASKKVTVECKESDIDWLKNKVQLLSKVSLTVEDKKAHLGKEKDPTTSKDKKKKKKKKVKRTRSTKRTSHRKDSSGQGDDDKGPSGGTGGPSAAGEGDQRQPSDRGAAKDSGGDTKESKGGDASEESRKDTSKEMSGGGASGGASGGGDAPGYGSGGGDGSGPPDDDGSDGKKREKKDRKKDAKKRMTRKELAKKRNEMRQRHKEERDTMLSKYRRSTLQMSALHQKELEELDKRGSFRIKLFTSQKPSEEDIPYLPNYKEMKKKYRRVLKTLQEQEVEETRKENGDRAALLRRHQLDEENHFGLFWGPLKEMEKRQTRERKKLGLPRARFDDGEPSSLTSSEFSTDSEESERDTSKKSQKTKEEKLLEKCKKEHRKEQAQFFFLCQDEEQSLTDKYKQELQAVEDSSASATLEKKCKKERRMLAKKHEGQKKALDKKQQNELKALQDQQKKVTKERELEKKGKLDKKFNPILREQAKDRKICDRIAEQRMKELEKEELGVKKEAITSGVPYCWLTQITSEYFKAKDKQEEENEARRQRMLERQKAQLQVLKEELKAKVKDKKTRKPKTQGKDVKKKKKSKVVTHNHRYLFERDRCLAHFGDQLFMLQRQQAEEHKELEAKNQREYSELLESQKKEKATALEELEELFLLDCDMKKEVWTKRKQEELGDTLEKAEREKQQELDKVKQELMDRLKQERLALEQQASSYSPSEYKQQEELLQSKQRENYARIIEQQEAENTRALVYLQETLNRQFNEEIQTSLQELRVQHQAQFKLCIEKMDKRHHHARKNFEVQIEERKRELSEQHIVDEVCLESTFTQEFQQMQERVTAEEHSSSDVEIMPFRVSGEEDTSSSSSDDDDDDDDEEFDMPQSKHTKDSRGGPKPDGDGQAPGPSPGAFDAASSEALEEHRKEERRQQRDQLKDQYKKDIQQLNINYDTSTLTLETKFLRDNVNATTKAERKAAHRKRKSALEILRKSFTDATTQCTTAFIQRMQGLSPSPEEAEHTSLEISSLLLLVQSGDAGEGSSSSSEEESLQLSFFDEPKKEQDDDEASEEEKEEEKEEAYSPPSPDEHTEQASVQEPMPIGSPPHSPKHTGGIVLDTEFMFKGSSMFGCKDFISTKPPSDDSSIDSQSRQQTDFDIESPEGSQTSSLTLFEIEQQSREEAGGIFDQPGEKEGSLLEEGATEGSVGTGARSESVSVSEESSLTTKGTKAKKESKFKKLLRLTWMGDKSKIKEKASVQTAKDEVKQDQEEKTTEATDDKKDVSGTSEGGVSSQQQRTVHEPIFPVEGHILEESVSKIPCAPRQKAKLSLEPEQSTGVAILCIKPFICERQPTVDTEQSSSDGGATTDEEQLEKEIAALEKSIQEEESQQQQQQVVAKEEVLVPESSALASLEEILAACESSLGEIHETQTIVQQALEASKQTKRTVRFSEPLEQTPEDEVGSQDTGAGGKGTLQRRPSLLEEQKRLWEKRREERRQKLLQQLLKSILKKPSSAESVQPPLEDPTKKSEEGKPLSRLEKIKKAWADGRRSALGKPKRAKPSSMLPSPLTEPVDQKTSQERGDAQKETEQKGTVEGCSTEKREVPTGQKPTPAVRSKTVKVSDLSKSSKSSIQASIPKQTQDKKPIPVPRKKVSHTSTVTKESSTTGTLTRKSVTIKSPWKPLKPSEKAALVKQKLQEKKEKAATLPKMGDGKEGRCRMFETREEMEQQHRRDRVNRKRCTTSNSFVSLLEQHQLEEERFEEQERQQAQAAARLDALAEESKLEQKAKVQKLIKKQKEELRSVDKTFLQQVGEIQSKHEAQGTVQKVGEKVVLSLKCKEEIEIKTLQYMFQRGMTQWRHSRERRKVFPIEEKKKEEKAIESKKAQEEKKQLEKKRRKEAIKKLTMEHEERVRRHHSTVLEEEKALKEKQAQEVQAERKRGGNIKLLLEKQERELKTFFLNCRWEERALLHQNNLELKEVASSTDEEDDVTSTKTTEKHSKDHSGDDPKGDSSGQGGRKSDGGSGSGAGAADFSPGIGSLSAGDTGTERGGGRPSDSGKQDRRPDDTSGQGRKQTAGGRSGGDTSGQGTSSGGSGAAGAGAPGGGEDPEDRKDREGASGGTDQQEEDTRTKSKKATKKMKYLEESKKQRKKKHRKERRLFKERFAASLEQLQKEQALEIQSEQDTSVDLTVLCEKHRQELQAFHQHQKELKEKMLRQQRREDRGKSIKKRHKRPLTEIEQRQKEEKEKVRQKYGALLIAMKEKHQQEMEKTKQSGGDLTLLLQEQAEEEERFHRNQMDTTLAALIKTHNQERLDAGLEPEVGSPVSTTSISESESSLHASSISESETTTDTDTTDGADGEDQIVEHKDLDSESSDDGQGGSDDVEVAEDALEVLVLTVMAPPTPTNPWAQSPWIPEPIKQSVPSGIGKQQGIREAADGCCPLDPLQETGSSEGNQRACLGYYVKGNSEGERGEPEGESSDESGSNSNGSGSSNSGIQQHAVTSTSSSDGPQGQGEVRTAPDGAVGGSSGGAASSSTGGAGAPPLSSPSGGAGGGSGSGIAGVSGAAGSSGTTGGHPGDPPQPVVVAAIQEDPNDEEEETVATNVSPGMPPDYNEEAILGSLEGLQQIMQTPVKSAQSALTSLALQSRTGFMSPDKRFRAFASMDGGVSAHSEHRNPHTSQFGIIVRPIASIRLGVAYTYSKEHTDDLYGVRSSSAVGFATSRVATHMVSSLVTWNAEQSGCTAHLGIAYGMGDVKNTRYFSYLGDVVSTKGTTDTSLIGSVAQLGYALRFPTLLFTPYIECVSVVAWWKPYGEERGLLPATLTKSKEQIVELSLGLRNRWSITELVQLQTWVKAIDGKRKSHGISALLKPPFVPLETSIPYKKKTYTQVELGTSLDIRVMKQFGIGVNGSIRLSKQKEMKRNNVGIRFWYDF